MSQPQILEETPIGVSDVQEALARIHKRDGELSFRAGKTVDHLNHLQLVAAEKKAEIYKAVETLDIPRLKPTHINKIIDIMPTSVKELAIVLSGYTLTVNKDNQQKILSALES